MVPIRRLRLRGTAAVGRRMRVPRMVARVMRVGMRRRVGLLVGPRPPRRRVVLKHRLGVLLEHVLQVLRHRVEPEEVVTERGVCVDALVWVEREELVQQVQRVGVLDETA